MWPENGVYAKSQMSRCNQMKATFSSLTTYFSLQVTLQTISSSLSFSFVKQKVSFASSAEKMKSFSPSIRIQRSAKSAGLCFTSKKRTHNMIS